jgi:hypothetical protein
MRTCSTSQQTDPNQSETMCTSMCTDMSIFLDCYYIRVEIQRCRRDRTGRRTVRWMDESNPCRNPAKHGRMIIGVANPSFH